MSLHASPTCFSGTTSTPEVAIVGAGVIGLGIGWCLAKSGCSVAIFERGEAGRGASWAAAGMLAAGLEAEPGEKALLALNLESQRRWPAFRQQVEAAAGFDIGYRNEGSLRIALNRDDVEKLRFDYEFQIECGINLQWLNGIEARQLEAHLCPGVQAATFSPNDHQVDSRRLTAALKAAFQGQGGQLHETTAVSAVDVVDGTCRGVVVGDDVHGADIVVWATGPWAHDPDVLPPAALPPVRPIKGQMLSLQMNPKMPLLNHVLRAPKAYLVPRHDGRLIIGATVEEAGFDDRLTAGGLLTLLEGAWQALPSVEDMPIDESWVGFRPGSRDDAPILGPSTVDGLLLANGHHRHGILLTPLTSEAISQLILTGHPPDCIKEFSPQRFRKMKEAMS
ncbi:MAG: glycine oxidase ThiO [Pseudomonadota bacterium]